MDGFNIHPRLSLSTVYTAAEQKLAVLQIRAPIIQVNARQVEQQMDCIIFWLYMQLLSNYFGNLTLFSHNFRQNLKGSDSCWYLGLKQVDSPGQ